MLNNSSVFGNNVSSLSSEKCVLRYFTFQSEYTLNCLENDGIFTSFIYNDTLREVELENALGQKGLVYYSVYRNLDSLDDVYNPNLGEHLIELDASKLPKERIEMSPSEFDGIEINLCEEFDFLRDSIGDYPSEERWNDCVINKCRFDKNFFFRKREFDEKNRMFGVMSVLTNEMVKEIHRDFLRT